MMYEFLMILIITTYPDSVVIQERFKTIQECKNVSNDIIRTVKTNTNPVYNKCIKVLKRS